MMGEHRRKEKRSYTYNDVISQERKRPNTYDRKRPTNMTEMEKERKDNEVSMTT